MGSPERYCIKTYGHMLNGYMFIAVDTEILRRKESKLEGKKVRK